MVKVDTASKFSLDTVFGVNNNMRQHKTTKFMIIQEDNWDGNVSRLRILYDLPNHDR